jgi:hypothetical protein
LKPSIGRVMLGFTKKQLRITSREVTHF